MSDNRITLIPEDPLHVPDAGRRKRARDRFAEIAPNAAEIEIVVSDRIEFFGCATSLERIGCPSCDAEISIEWWQDRMDDDCPDGGFALAQYVTPCCGTLHSLDRLQYVSPQGFARFAIDVLNPDIALLDDQQRAEFEEILGTRFRVIYQHI